MPIRPLAAGDSTLTGNIATPKLGAQDGWYSAQLGSIVAALTGLAGLVGIPNRFW